MKRAAAQALALAALIAACYVGSLGAPFVFDDVPSIVQNPHLERLWPLSLAARSADHVESSFAGRPVASYTLALSYALSGRAVWGYHALSIALHVANAWLLLAIGLSTFRKRGLGTAGPHLAFAATALWAVHPLASEAVVYASARSELLVSTFLLAALAAALPVFAGSAHRAVWTATAAACGLLAVGSKENAAALPLVVLLYDRAFVSGGFVRALRRHAALHAALFATWLPLAALVALGARGRTVGFDLGLSPHESLYTQAGVILHYARLAVWPHELQFVYDWVPVRTLRAALPELAVVAAAALATLAGIFRRPRLAFAPACAFAILAPTSSAIPIVSELAAEKRMYLPLAPLAAAAVVGAWLALRAAAARLAIGARPLAAGAAVAGAAVLAAASAATAARVAVYRSDLALWSDTLAQAPDHPWVHNNLGVAYRERGEVARAEQHFRRAVEIRPSLAPAWVNLGNLRLREGDLEAAIAAYREALRSLPDAFEVQYDLGLALARAGRITEALPHFEAAVRIHPSDRTAHVALARTYRRLGDPARAASHEEIAAALER
ncbi:MAG TPA: tetratricopeptide repeat protein [Myxococcota bacterium]|nr:tetratricopeptide repeat protein [Myxococcota bacterium]